MNFSWRITKYNPQNRNKNGSYIPHEWTSYSDIGKTFENKKLTKKNYIKAENAYLNAIESFMNCNQIKSLTIINLEKPNTINNDNLSQEELKLIKKLKNNLKLNKDEILILSRLILREYIWCKLIHNEKMYVHFGYDFYMYIGSKNECKDTINKIQKSGLFIEKLQSPYN